MYYLKLIFKNVFRAKLRTALTVTGLVVAIVAFGLLQTVVDAWFAGANSASSARLVTRNAISLVFSMPTYYRERMRSIDGVKTVSYSQWFGGIYKEPSNFFPQFAVDHNNYFDLYPEFLIKPDELLAFKRDRQGAIVGRKLADQFGWKVGDVIPIRGTIFSGNWQFTIRAIFDGRDETTLTRQFFMHWDYINESVKKRFPRRGDQIGVFNILINDPSRAADISKAIDAEFRNSLAETLTETEKAFQLGFVAQSEAIVVAIRVVSFVVIFIIMAVVANTMAMTARERIAEYATLKVLGFSPGYVAALIFGEAMVLAFFGAGIGILLTFPMASGFANSPAGAAFASFAVSASTVWLQVACAVAVGVIAALVPGWRSARVKIVDGLRHVG
ncbi:MAG: ABC transporter permease [Burkholderiales bacterium]|jgi:putative ABC transport system permease protein|nr:FtsX-like permease family protein [Rhodocyclaceae bacterium]MCE2722117.1 FtsX-like permease family protein [Betaproteobacteria bacterium]MCA3023528.1 FtsX-like permease family protein [Rhodocyclaceae bacterium]MCA3043717.1 FtsX-like permease family protein [Rhodocyclaceae bacterium]MCA3054012.1 FtsX-like permease family protein [Rhodocyclaceae bacterium]